jgi:N-acetylglucosaminyldiphosphoundecaprenol N-acetyl-beta-D-mannosaminyltransferase
MDEAVVHIVELSQKKDVARIVCTANLDHLATVQTDLLFRTIYKNADFVVADGMPLVWLSKFTTCRLKERVAGSDLLWELGRASQETGVKLFFLGGQPHAAEATVTAICHRYPNAHITGTYCPPFGTLDEPAELARIKDVLTKTAPDILLVGFGSPKQEKWIAEHKDLMKIPVSIGVGGSFDMAAGVVKRAPLWMQRTGFEWLFRFLQEPTRLWRRYFAKDMPFLIRMVGVILLDRLRTAAAPIPPRTKSP